MKYKPLLMMRTRGLGVQFQKVANLTANLARSVGVFISAGGGFNPPHFDDFDFIAAYKGETDGQNVGINGYILNLMPKGTITATSAHSTPIMALDYEGIYQEYPIDDPVWRGGRVVGDPVTETYATTEAGALISPHPYLQANIAATNLLLWSEDLTNSAWNKRNGSTVTNDEITVTNANTNSVISQSIDGLNVNGIFRVTAKLWADRDLTVQLELLDNADGSDEVPFNVDLTTTPQVFTFIADYSLSLTFGGSLGFYINRKVVSILGLVIGLTNVMIEEISSVDASPSPYIPTTTAAASIPALAYTYPAANIDPADSVIEFDIDYQGDDTGVIDIGGVGLLTILAGDLILNDGSGNIITTPLSIGEHSIKVILGTSSMSLTVDGALIGDSTYAPITAGLITVEEDMYAFRSNPA